MLAFALTAVVFCLHGSHAAAATCAPSADFGTVTSTTSIPATGTYRVWSRIQIPSNTNNSYMLEIDGNCYTVTAASGTATNQWVWIDYKDGTDSGANKITLTNFSQGNHTVKMIGNSDGVLLDRVIFTQDLTTNGDCKPSMGKGDLCANPPDTEAPQVSISSPSGGTVSGNVSVAATATDNVGVTTVGLYLNGSTTPIDTKTVSPASTSYAYSYSWNTTTGFADGLYSLVVKATDAAGNPRSSSPISVTVANGKPDFIVTSASIAPASPKAGDAVTISAVVKNIGTVAGPPGTIDFKIDGATKGSKIDAISLGANSTVTEVMSATWPATAGNHTLLVTADSATPGTTEAREDNNTLSLPITVSSPDTNPPNVTITAPTAGTSVTGASVTVNVTATDGSGESGMSRVEFYLDASGTPLGTDTASPYSFAWNSTLANNGLHTLKARAYDLAGNFKDATVNITVANGPVNPKDGDVNGDSKIDIKDAALIAANWDGSGKTRAQGDLNGDGFVNIKDASLLAAAWGH